MTRYQTAGVASTPSHPISFLAHSVPQLTVLKGKMFRIAYLLLLSCLPLPAFASIDRAPQDEDPFKAHFKRQIATKELVFTYESENWVGTAFLVEIFGATYIATNRHVLDSVIFKGDDQFKLENAFGRWLKIDSNVYLQLNESELGNDLGTDLILIPHSFDKFHYVTEPFSISGNAPQMGQTAITYGNTDGQGYINAKEGIINGIEGIVFGLIAAAREGNSGGPVLGLNNRVVGMLTAGGGPKGPQGGDQNICIRLDHDVVSEWYGEGKFELKQFPDNVVNFYKEEIYTDIVPEPHHSRDKQTPHLSIGLAVSNLDDANIGSLEQLEQVWDMKRRGNHRPLLCYNFDVLPRDRQIKLCATYGQTMAEFIPREWFKTMLSSFVTEAEEAFQEISENHSRALRARHSLGQVASRDESISKAKEFGIFKAMRDAYNSNSRHGFKMRLSGELARIEECIETMDTGE
jgi:hypothetical protein